MKRVLAFTLALLMVGTLSYAQERGGRRGPGARVQAPAAQGAVRQRYPGPSSRVQRGAPPASRHYAVPRPAYRPHYNTRPYARGPRGYAPYSGYRTPYPYAYGYGYRYYPHTNVSIYPGGWVFGGVYGGVSVYYEKQTVVPPPAPPTEVVVGQGTSYVFFEVDAFDAEVLVDGAYAGVVEHFSQRPLDIPAGEHVVELRYQGQSTPFRIRADAGQSIKIRAKLLR